MLKSGLGTFCQLGLHPGSLFAKDGQIVLLDWAVVGLGVALVAVPTAALDAQI
ncbi:MAG: hypothetical protein ACYCS7_04845 [Acidimicrobiales bacterium]